MALDLSSNTKGFTFKWILENFEYCVPKKGDLLLKSPAFIVETMERTKWRLSIQPRREYESKSWISVYLNRELDSKGPAIVEVAFEFAFLASDGSVLKSQYANKYAFSHDQSWGFLNIIERKSVFDKRSMFMPEGALTIRCRMWKTGNIKHGQCVARTRVGVERKVFLWKIENFSLLDIGQEVLFKVKSTSDDKVIMCLKLFLLKNGSSNVIYIKFINSNQTIVFSTFKSSLINARGDYVDCSKHDTEFLASVQNEGFQLPLSKNRLMKDKSLYLPNDSLTLSCELAFSAGAVFEGIEDTCYECSGSSKINNALSVNIKAANIKNSEPSDLKMDLSSMLQNNILCDVKLCVESETLLAHWFILSARSPVFRAMFKSDMKEKANDKIHIQDLRMDTVRRMLLYMYTDSLEELDWETASDLLVAAEKYQILTLKDKCISFLKNNLNLKNACDILLLSVLFEESDLKPTVQDFILVNDKIIFNSSEWKLLMEANVHLAAETMLLRYKE